MSQVSHRPPDGTGGRKLSVCGRPRPGIACRAPQAWTAPAAASDTSPPLARPLPRSTRRGGPGSGGCSSPTPRRRIQSPEQLVDTPQPARHVYQRVHANAGTWPTTCLRLSGSWRRNGRPYSSALIGLVVTGQGAVMFFMLAWSPAWPTDHVPELPFWAMSSSRGPVSSRVRRWMVRVRILGTCGRADRRLPSTPVVAVGDRRRRVISGLRRDASQCGDRNVAIGIVRRSATARPKRSSATAVDDACSRAGKVARCLGKVRLEQRSQATTRGAEMTTVEARPSRWPD
jgi:hypothetical protein